MIFSPNCWFSQVRSYVYHGTPLFLIICSQIYILLLREKLKDYICWIISYIYIQRKISIATPTSLSTPACPGGKVHVQCMNTCPVTCDNPNPPFCTSFVCIRGCECPQGLALHNDMCIRPDQCPTGECVQGFIGGREGGDFLKRNYCVN